MKEKKKKVPQGTGKLNNNLLKRDFKTNKILFVVSFLVLVLIIFFIYKAVVFIQNNEKQPLSLFLANINTEQIGVSFAGAVFFAFPILLVLLWGQDFIRDGINLSGVKG